MDLYRTVSLYIKFPAIPHDPSIAFCISKTKELFVETGL